MNLKLLGLAFVLAGALLSCAASAQTFTILSMNVLRFGHGSRLANQCNAITAASATVDIIVLQEVMLARYPCLANNNSKGVNIPIPKDFAYISSVAKGRSSYVEYYGILYRTNQRNQQQIKLMEENDALSTTATFMRPPYAARFQVTDSSTSTPKSCDVWIVNIHSIFGNKVSDRQAEAAAMLGVYKALTNMKNGSVIVAGDWNLPADDKTGFGWVNGNDVAIDPNVPTSLTTAGMPSSSYDHGVYTKAQSSALPQVTFAQTGGSWTYTGTYSLLNWRRDVSDHMGVVAKVSLTC
ncbi:hypothetical protein C8R31_10659 [Nitrosospira sp. Nsp2]|uniref:endonuclease/exonuclease/phosphatase family protein n=1 Tax=Nitrosospira sp. Nsp2 TaxID=136548 RepID=UPI000D31415C|nr:endonuclease/exonuclease/phosphatase family protein [Nitrosospira sp. Nsp2]PTR14387.1 hypothetical protein C8R31_10659 [Nitrosospira sp. Nsp2]